MYKTQLRSKYHQIFS